MKLYADMIRYNMVDAIVATGASIVDMDFFEALGSFVILLAIVVLLLAIVAYVWGVFDRD